MHRRTSGAVGRRTVGNGNSSPNRAGGTPLDRWDPPGSKLADLLTTDNLGWQDKANCKGADADLFFPERGASTRRRRRSALPVSVRVEVPRVRLCSSEKFGLGRSLGAGAAPDS